MPEQLPIVPSIPRYTVSTVIAGRLYALDMHWNSRDDSWYLGILAEDETPIRTGIRVVLDVALGRECVDPLFPPSLIVASDTSNTDREATIDDMGVRVGVYWFSPDEVLALARASAAGG